MEIQTPRLFLREYEPNDRFFLQKRINSLDVSRYLSKVQFPYTLEDADAFIRYAQQKKETTPREGYNFVITTKGSSDLIGSIGLSDVKDTNAVLGYWLSPEFWGKGFMSEAVGGILSFAKDRLHLETIIADVFVQNIGSAKVLEKAGFEKQETLKEIRAKSTGLTHKAYSYVCKL
ncbi:MAG: GNAT family N-acetyltransferase [Candidatus Woesearchaeota archaeon]